MFTDIFGNAPRVRLLDFLADHPDFDYTISQMAEFAEIARPTVYKLVEVRGRGDRDATGVVKLSPGKETWPGQKQVWRFMRSGRAAGDVIGAADEPAPEGGVALLKPAMRAGKRLIPSVPLPELCADCRRSIDTLPEDVRALDAGSDIYPVRMSDRLQDARSVLSHRSPVSGRSQPVRPTTDG